jgi:hypothetical protein
MINNDKTTIRQELNFLEEAKSAFQYLENYGYKISYEDITLLTYEGLLGKIVIFHGRSSYEIGIEIYPPNDKKNVFYLTDIIGIKNDNLARQYYNPTITKKKDMKIFLEKQANILREYGERIFNGDTSIWKELEGYNKKRVDLYWDSIKMSTLREKANIAFKEKNYNAFIKIVEGNEDLLNDLERKKLLFAKKRRS